MSEVHYVAIAGHHGSEPDFSYAYVSCDDAVKALLETYKLEGDYAKSLEDDGYVELDKGIFGVEYAMIEECRCSDMVIHNEEPPFRFR